jgi:hypothetical protein
MVILHKAVVEVVMVEMARMRVEQQAVQAEMVLHQQ